jgi:hypothetical protein
MQANADADFPDAMQCPSCARHVGARRECPYCGADCPRPRGWRLLTLLALLAATFGLLLVVRLAAPAAGVCLRVPPDRALTTVPAAAQRRL